MKSVFFSMFNRSHGFLLGIASTKAWLSEIICIFPRPLGRKWENRAENHPKMYKVKIETKFNYFPMFKGFYIVSYERAHRFFSLNR